MPISTYRYILRPDGAQFLWSCDRWGNPEQQPGLGSPSGSVDWRSRYVSADTDECQQALCGVAEELHAVFVDLQRAKRTACLSRAAAEDMAELPRCAVQERLAQWR